MKQVLAAIIVAGLAGCAAQPSRLDLGSFEVGDKPPPRPPEWFAASCLNPLRRTTYPCIARRLDGDIP